MLKPLGWLNIFSTATMELSKYAELTDRIYKNLESWFNWIYHPAKVT